MGRDDGQDPAATRRTSNRIVLAPGYSGLRPGTTQTSRRDWTLVRLSGPITSAPLLPIATDSALHSRSVTIAGGAAPPAPRAW